jgi:bifunctional non-homologous end joining protein LigD
MPRFVIQKHAARSLHYDFRLEIAGAYASWAVPKGPSTDPREKRLAMRVDDHQLTWGDFEGTIPEGEYGAGRHMIWDEGKYELVEGDDASSALEAGRLKFRLNGKKLRGEFNLVRMGGREGQWLLIKGRDEFAESGWQLELRVADDEVARAWLAAGEKKSAKRVAAPARVVRDPKGVKKFGTKARDDRKVVPAARLFKSKKLEGDVDVRVGREVVPLTRLERVYWPDDGLTKGDLIRYYYEVSEFILPYLKGRPLIMKRYPAGIRGQSFHQHDVDEVPRFVPTVALEVEDGGGHEVDYIVGDNLPTLLYMANLGAIERHPWHSRTRSLDRPDWFVFDLDPSEGVRFETICELAVAVRGVLGKLGLKSYPKTSGSRGIHIYVPVKPAYGYEEIARLAEIVATEVARARSDMATVERALRKRGAGRIYVDHMQNARGKSVVAPYSVRPRPGASVSAPVTWDEVERAQIAPQDFTIKNVLARIRRKGDLFRPVLENRQSLTRAFELAEEMSGAGRKSRGARA